MYTDGYNAPISHLKLSAKPHLPNTLAGHQL
jgi:hypothetical protein